ncbi:MAG TPA: 4-hydroxythreonine-4-phosphate dehydrogenase PdxA [Burkholderiales bacterium]
MKTSRPDIAIVLGDPNGVGPELAVRLLARPENQARANLLILADPQVLEAGERTTGLRIAPTRCESAQAADFSQGKPVLVPLDLLRGGKITPGKATEAAGRTALRALDAAADAAMAGHADAIVFAPLNKQALRMAGLAHEDELRHLQERFGVTAFVSEFNITQGLWTSRVTSHIPLREVSDALTVEGVCEAIAILDRSLKDAGVAAPRIGVAALNPHAGDGGNCGDEEIRIIAPAVEKMRAAGVNATGPLPSDTVFVAARKGTFDAVVSMYHDQGQIAMKLMGFEGGVTLHGGLPVAVATCASGTAFDIAGQGIASVDGLQNAFDIAVRMGATRRAARAAH